MFLSNFCLQETTAEVNTRPFPQWFAPTSPHCRNEALVIISVEDINDEKPQFVVPKDSSTVMAYPEDVALQKVVGPVITVQVRQVDNYVDTHKVPYDQVITVFYLGMLMYILGRPGLKGGFFFFW